MIRKENKRLKGFTLIEIIVTMILSGILLSLAIKIILTISSIGNDQNQSSIQNNTLLILQSVLSENFISSTIIVKNEDHYLTFYYSNTSPIKICFNPSEVILSSNLLQDTFRIHWNNFELEYLKSDSSLVKKLSFEVQDKNLIYPFYFKKEYPNQILYNSETDGN